MKQRIFCLADLHGHYDQLIDLMDKLYQEHNLNLEKDVLVQLGDMVDGGDDTKKVLDWAIDLKEMFPKNFIPILGNHESLLLDAFNPEHPIYGDYYLWWRQGGQATLESFKPQNFSDYEKAIMQPKDLITEKYLNFIKELDLYYETEDYFFVHAGLYPNRTIEDHKNAVKASYPLGFHPSMMAEGDMAYDMIWIREPFIGSDWDWGKKIVFGHTVLPYGMHMGRNENGEPMSVPGYPLVMDNKIGIDGMAHETGRLIAVILPEEKFVYSQWSE